ncbi:uncharacterized protein LOC124302046 [Neodiprion virginianus]|uniref:uncharacterized protein LOC124302046 n=1 Tax=Neodiprion virginianus TaxID=2961670 RepID=UPI001EE69D77|nr:uncharacterized protein LOC124302046 [Neodiprion virginianus]
MIHDNVSLSAIQKFQYLRSALKEEALQVIGGLDTSAENYVNAWELLKNNYENTKLLVNTHLNKLLDFPAVAKDKPATMRQLIVHIRTHLKALRTLRLPVEHWDDLLIHMVKPKLDYNAQRDWEEEANRKSRTIEMIDRGKNKTETTKPPAPRKPANSVSVATATQQSCPVCSNAHGVFECSDFLQMSISDRIQGAKKKKICLNCLDEGHFSANCRSSGCKRCQEKHNTLLHIELHESTTTSQKGNEAPNNPVVTLCAKEEQPNLPTSAVVNVVRKPNKQIILSTAHVHIDDEDGIPQSCRLLLDPGSQSNIITEDLVRRLKLRCRKQNEFVTGINQVQTHIAKIVDVKITSMHTDYTAKIECLVLPNITERLPQLKLNKGLISLPKELKLADPSFHEPGKIDLLVGAGLFWQLLCADSIKQQKGVPRLQNTLLGWIVGGELIDAASKNPSRFCGLITNTVLQAQLERFWNQEESRETRSYTREEAECERQFMNTLKRYSDGRFIVALPQKSDVKLGESVRQAKRRLATLERRLKSNPQIKAEYAQCLQDYEQQGHMSLAPDVTSARTEDTFVLPHQLVIRPESITTKLRVVFDGSAKTSFGTSLNDKLLIGPNLQKDLFEIILRFRSHKVVLTGDITAMFRQIRVREEDRGLQTILWRSDVSQPIQTYQLNTVTYGTAPAPFLAMRCLRQLAAEDSKYPQAAKTIEEDFYMDDVLTDAETIEKAVSLQQQVSKILQRGQFQLRKWRSNDDRALVNLSHDSEADSLLKLDKEGALKTLGLLWDAKTDIMQYSVTIDESTKISKRLVLSKIAQIFDPLGLLGSTLINAKCIMQQIWQLQTGWDENLPPQLQNTWDEYYNSLPKINEIRIPRNINPGNDSGKFDLIGFGDASEKAYGACLYAVSRNSKGETNSHLICSKENMANRVTKIQNLTRNAVWLHVPSEHNPADLISRGMTVEDWETRDLWWHGPPWLKTGEWPEQKTINIDTSEMKPSVVLISSKSTSDVLRKFSTYGKLERVLAYCIRFRFNALGPKQSGSLTVEELERAEKAIVKMTQRESFFPEYNALKQGEQVPKGSKLAVLSPFLDKRELFE